MLLTLLVDSVVFLSLLYLTQFYLSPFAEKVLLKPITIITDN